MRTFRIDIVIIILTALLPAAAVGHETDQYSVPVGKEFADLRFYISDEVYKRINSAVNKVNSLIEQSLRDNSDTRQTDYLQSPFRITSAVHEEFPNFVYHIHYWEIKLGNSRTQPQFPGFVVAYKPAFWIYHHWTLTLDPTKLVRLVRTSTIMINDTYLGTDKLSHFFNMGYIYYLSFQRSRKNGLDESAAAKRAVTLSAGLNPIYSERRILGELTTGVRSNADLAANYVGMKFYRNLTEEVRLKGSMRQPMLVRDGAYWKFNGHVRPHSDFFSIFISDHFDEALNPNYYWLGMKNIMQGQVRDRCDDMLRWYKDEQGNRMGKEQFANINKALGAYFGEDYGHERDFERIISIANTCFDHDAPIENAGMEPADNTIMLASASGDILPDTAYFKGMSGLPEKTGANGADKFGRTAVWWAARNGDIDKLKDLISSGVDVNIADIDGDSPLHTALKWGHGPVTELLLANGADANAASLYGITPLHLAVRAMDSGSVSALLEHGADVNATDDFGCTPLHDIAVRGHEIIAEMLIAAGADPESTDIYNTTPLHRAARAGNPEMVKKLMSLGADSKARNLLGRTSIDEALPVNNGEIFEYLPSH